MTSPNKEHTAGPKTTNDPICERMYKLYQISYIGRGLTNQGVSLDLVGACDVADMVRLETLTADNDTLVAGHRVAEASMVRDRCANISQLYGGKWNRTEFQESKAWEAGIQERSSPSGTAFNSLKFGYLAGIRLNHVLLPI